MYWLIAYRANGLFGNEVHHGPLLEWLDGHVVEGDAQAVIIWATLITEDEYWQRDTRVYIVG